MLKVEKSNENIKMPAKRRRKYHGLYYHSSPPKILPMNGSSQLNLNKIGRDDGGFIVKPASIRIWIHDKDVGKLTRVLWTGQANRLRSETSTNPKVRKFLENVPSVMNVIKSVHQAVIDNNLELLQSQLDDPPPSLMTTKDANGLTVIHKAAGLGHGAILDYLLKLWPNGALAIDATGKTPLHWAASAKNNTRCYNQLIEAGADEECLDYRMKNPIYYRTRPNDIDRSYLSVVPDAPRIPQDNLPDWTALIDDIGSLEEPSGELVKRRISEAMGDGGFKLLASRSDLLDIEAISEPDFTLNGVVVDTEESITSIQPNTSDQTVANLSRQQTATVNSELNTNDDDTKVKTPETPKNDTNNNAGDVADKDDDGTDDLEFNDEDLLELGISPHPLNHDSSTDFGETTTAPTDDNQNNSSNMVSDDDHDGGGDHDGTSGEESEEASKDVNEEDDEECGNEGDDGTEEATNDDDDNLSMNSLMNVSTTNHNYEQLRSDQLTAHQILLEDDNSPVNNNSFYTGIDDDTINKPKVRKTIYEATDSDDDSDFTHIINNSTTHNQKNKKKNADKDDDDDDNDDEEYEDEGDDNDDDDVENSVATTNDDVADGQQSNENEEEEEQDGHDDDDDDDDDQTPTEDTNTPDTHKMAEVERPYMKVSTAEMEKPYMKLSTAEVEKPYMQSTPEVEKPYMQSTPEVEKPYMQSTAEVEKPYMQSTAEVEKPYTRLSTQETANYNSMIAKKLTESLIPSQSMEIKGLVHGEADDNQVQSQSAVLDDDDDDDDDDGNRVKKVVESGDMEELAGIVLSGEGSKLIGLKSERPEIQAFLDNITSYMSKIRRVHLAARSGNLRDLQSALDRRKFAIARDATSPNGATPLHVAIVFGHAGIIRYLAGRFPETTAIIDENGRSALHYAATVKDNGHFYNLLTHFGANPKLADNLGNIPDFYKNAEKAKDILSHKLLLKDFGADENLETQKLNDQVLVEVIDTPMFGTEQGRYLATTLGEPLIKGLTEIADKRPNDPILYLAEFLIGYVNIRKTVDLEHLKPNTIKIMKKVRTPPLNGFTESETIQSILSNQSTTSASVSSSLNPFQSLPPQFVRDIDELTGDNTQNETDDDTPNPSLTERDEHGQSLLHFACSRSHPRNALYQIIEESKTNITYRDELYRTARDVALQANQPSNARDIDRHVIALAVLGETKPFEDFAISGYDHILDCNDDDGKSIQDIVRLRGHSELSTFLDAIRLFEMTRERLHSAIRLGNFEKIQEFTSMANATVLIKSKNYFGRTALHIAILKEKDDVVEYLLNICLEVLKIGDNLERTPLHYAMGIFAVEKISRLLIKNGARRTIKDLKGRQPSYYFMNKSEILRLKEEEDDENRIYQ